jgi:hypothetical protein
MNTLRGAFQPVRRRGFVASTHGPLGIAKGIPGAEVFLNSHPTVTRQCFVFRRTSKSNIESTK